MSEENTSWFHCGRCGSLFRAPVRDSEDRRCGVCGKVPSIGTQAVALVEPLAVGSVVQQSPGVKRGDAAEPESSRGGDERGRDSSGERRRRGGGVAWKVGLGWLLFLGALTFVVRHFWSDEPQRAGAGGNAGAGAAFAGTSGDEAKVFLDEAFPQCQQVLVGFLQATSAEERNQYVYSPVRTASRMARFYSLNPLVTMDPATLAFAGASLLNLPDERAIETRWSDGEGRMLDVVFRQENGEWRIDWAHFVRESDYPWALFLAGDGEPEGEFRLLVRERLADEREPGEPISLMLHAPQFGEPGTAGVGSPEILVDAESPAGLLLEAAFRTSRAGRPLFGSVLGLMDPPGMTRVRVKVKRSEGETGRGFEITEVVACHWLSLDVVGVDLEDTSAGKPVRGADRSRIDDD